MKLNDLRVACVDLWRFLTFRATIADYDRFGVPHFVLGLAATWLVGIARNWDLPDAPLFARLGLASVGYIFFMTMMLWLSGFLPSPTRRGYGKVLTIVAMTAPPGLVYGIPVERFMSSSSAQSTNLTFLGIVATWRVTLAVHFFIRGCQNKWFTSVAIVFLPIVLLIMSLVATGRAGYVMDIMGGVRDRSGPQSAVDDAIASLFCLSFPLAVVGVIVYISAVAVATPRVRDRTAESASKGESED